LRGKATVGPGRKRFLGKQPPRKVFRKETILILRGEKDGECVTGRDTW
jgi:hypothetical protein